MAEQAKISVYEKRHSTSIPAPLEVDSDSDFAPGAFVPELKAKRKRRAGLAPPSDGKRRKRRRDILESSTNGLMRSKRRRPASAGAHGPNPLLEYFAQELDLHSESEKEEGLGSVEGVEPNKDEDEDENEDENIEEQEPIVLKTWAGFTRGGSSKNSPVPTHSGEIKDDNQADGSATESDSQPEEDFFKVPHVINQHKRPRPENLEDDSITESDSEVDVWITKTATTSPKKRESSATDSQTESESESEITADPSLKPRPGFPLAPGQIHLGPLVLDKDKKIMVPAALNTYLRDYQRDGVKFFWQQYREGRGGLLGDDMGLVREFRIIFHTPLTFVIPITATCKTIQVISFLSAIMHKNGVITDKRRRRDHVSRLQDRDAWKLRRELPRADAKWPTCLIIAPSTVIHNWQREFETWGYFEVGMYNGSLKERTPVLRDFKMGRLDVVLTTFDLARRDIDVLDSLPWTCVFVDEVHRVKNYSAKITMAYHQFVCTRRFGLTGTTIQNSYNEMWTILDWTNPGRLGTSRQWQGFVAKPLTVGQSAGATEEERAKALVVARILKDKLLPRFFLRRTKDIIKAQLPEKTDQVVFCPLTPRQIAAYKHLLEMAPVQNLILKDHPCPCGSNKSRKGCCYPFVPGDVFRYMSILIKLSNHLGLILPTPTDTPEQMRRNRILAEAAFPDGDIPKYGTAMMQPQFCGKWGVLEILLNEWRKDTTNKVLIFTKSVKLLDMLEFHLNTRSYGFLKLDGSTKQTDRMPMIDKFHSDPEVFIFLISTLAGGTGLNLTGANKVVIFDPNWNPAHDLQAMDRAFRFGQTRDVAVYRLLGAGSVEELIYARQIYKQQQMAIGYDASIQTRYFEGVQGDTTKKGELFGIENIFKLHEDKLATKMAIERANLAELDWALANMGSRSRKQAKNSSEDWIAEAEAKGSKDKDDGNLRGLGALLFDDDPLLGEPREQDIIQKTLNAIGVKYSHHNDEILVPSRIEEERTKKTLLQNRHKKSKASLSKGPPQPQWPPKRKHHKPLPTPEEQLASRHQALIELGMINRPSDVPTFARDFARQTPEMQREILAELDKWKKMQGTDDDTD